MENMRKTGPAITEQHLQQTDLTRKLGRQTALSTVGTSVTMQSRANDGRGMPDVTSEPWMRAGLCAQTYPDVFASERKGGIAAAKKICSLCEVKPQCLDYALKADEPYGIWGGLTKEERDALKKRS